MAKELRLDVVAKKDSVQLSELAAEFDRLSKSVDDNGKSLQKNASFSKTLDAQIAQTKKQVHDLGVEFDKTGNVDVFKNLRNAEKNVAGLERLKKQLSTSLTIDIGQKNNKGGLFASLFGSSIANDAIQAGQTAGKAFEGGFSGVLKTVFSNPYTGGAAAVLAAGLAVDVGAAVGGAVTAGIGAGGLAVGIAGALNDPRVAQAKIALGDDLSHTLTKAGASFVVPVEKALRDLDYATVLGGDKLASAIAPLAAAVIPLEKGIEGLASAALPGLRKGFADAEPVIEQVAKELPGLGRAIGDTIGKITSNVAENKAAIQLTFQLIDKTIEGLGTLLSTSEKVFGGFIKAAEPIAHFDKAVFGWLPVVGDQVHHASDEVDGLNHTLNETKGVAGIARDAFAGTTTALSKQADAAKTASTDFAALAGSLNKTIDTADTLAGAASDKVLGALLSGDHAALGWQESLTGLSDSFAQNGKQLDITTAKGQANREAVLSVVEANIRTYDSNIAAGDSAQDAAAKYDANTESLRKQLGQAGLTKDAVNGLIGKYTQVPDKVNTNIALEGLTDALNNLTILTGAINGIPKYVKIEAAIEAVDASGLSQNVANKHRAGGGPVTAGVPYIVGERRPELFVPATNGTIIPNIPSFAAPSYRTFGGSTGSSGPVRATLAVSGGGGGTGLGSLISELIRTGQIQLFVDASGAVRSSN